MEQQSMLFAEIVAMAGVFGLGLSMFLLGSIKIRLTNQLGINDAQMGKLFSVYNFSNLVFVLVAGIVCDPYGFQTVAVIGFAAGAITMFLLGQAKNYGMAMIGCLLLGIGSMFMNTAGNVLLGNPEIVYEDPGRSGNLGNVFFGIGAFCAPWLTSLLFDKFKMSGTLAILGIILALPLFFAIGGTFPDAGGNFSFAAAGALVAQPQIIWCALALMCYIALEVSMAGWITTYMTHVGASEVKASRVLSFFSIAIMVGRLVTALAIGGVLNLSMFGHWFVLGLAIASAVVLFYLTVANSEGIATIMMILIGLLFAPIFPTIAGLMFSRTVADMQGSGFSIIFAVGLLGAIFVPAWMGQISSGEGKTIKNSMAVAGGTAVLLAVISVIMNFALPPVL